MKLLLRYMYDVLTSSTYGLSALNTKLDTIDNFIDTEVASILATVNHVTYGNSALNTKIDTIDNLLDNEIADIYARLGAPVGADLSADIAAVKLAVDTVDNLIDNEVADIYARLGAPVGADLSADIAAVKLAVDTVDDLLDSEVAAIQADVDRIEARLIGATSSIYPTLAGAVQLTGGAGAWAAGAALVEIVPAATVAVEYYIDGIVVTAMTLAAQAEIWLTHGAGDTEFARITVTGPGTFYLRAQKAIPANDKIMANVATAAGGAQTADVKVQYHTA